MARSQFQTLSEPMYYILLALLKPCYGYEIMQKISEISKGRVQVGAGTLYALLSRFENEKMIIQIADDGRRKTYMVTENGKALLRQELNRLKVMSEEGEALLEE